MWIRSHTKTDLTYLPLFAPLIFVCHFLEEAPSFVAWFNAHVARGITSELFWTVNLAGLTITVLVTGADWLSRSNFTLITTIVWLSFLMLGNALLHIAGAIADRSYVPGLLTAVFLYLPYYFWLFIRTEKSKKVELKLLIVSAIVGALPMLLHGYLIIFRGSRLF